MALKSSREGLRKELVDYLGNIIVDDNLRNEIVKSVGDKFVTPEVLNENVNNLTIQITTESGERTEADNTLQNNITAETTAREGADTTLQNNITAEATAREGADTTLQNNINAETTARQEAIISLQASVEEALANSGKFYGIDTSKILYTIGNAQANYTATEDCIACITRAYIKRDVTIDNVLVGRTAGENGGGGIYPIKKGQVFKTSGGDLDTKVFGLL